MKEKKEAAMQAMGGKVVDESQLAGRDLLSTLGNMLSFFDIHPESDRSCSNSPFKYER